MRPSEIYSKSESLTFKKQQIKKNHFIGTKKNYHIIFKMDIKSLTKSNIH